MLKDLFQRAADLVTREVPEGDPPTAIPERASSFPTFLLVPFSPFLLVGLLALVYGGWQAIDHWVFLRRAVHTSGTVVGSHRRRHSDYPVVRYTAPNGENIQFEASFTRSRDSYRIPLDVGVLFDPENPRRAVIDSADSTYAVLMMPVFGLLVVGIGLGGAFALQLVTRRRGTSTPDLQA